MVKPFAPFVSFAGQAFWKRKHAWKTPKQNVTCLALAFAIQTQQSLDRCRGKRWLGVGNYLG
jgi:hypothetical protein